MKLIYGETINVRVNRAIQKAREDGNEVIRVELTKNEFEAFGKNWCREVDAVMRPWKGPPCSAAECFTVSGVSIVQKIPLVGT